MTIVSYILNALPYMAISFPFVAAFRLFRRRTLLKEGKHSSFIRETLVILLILFYVGVLSQTVIPKLEIAMDGSIHFMRNYGSSVNLIPFRQAGILFHEVFEQANYTYFFVNIIGNMVFFIPLGFCIPLLWNCTAKQVLLISLISGISIEVLQFVCISGRATDIDDVIIYMIGAVLGLFAYRIAKSHLSEAFEHFRVQM